MYLIQKYLTFLMLDLTYRLLEYPTIYIKKLILVNGKKV